MKNDRLRVGVITSPHGIKGEVNVYPTTDDIGRFKILKRVYLDLGVKTLETEVTSVRFFKGMAILKLSCIPDRNTAELYRKKDILIDREDAVPLEEGEYFICDLIGFKVVSDQGEELGHLDNVLQTGANDVYSVKDGSGSELLIPVTDECVLDIDTGREVITVHLLPGLR